MNVVSGLSLEKAGVIFVEENGGSPGEGCGRRGVRSESTSGTLHASRSDPHHQKRHAMLGYPSLA